MQPTMSKRETITAIVLLTLIGTSMHFVHHVPFFNRFLGYIFPVKESVMAHMKMVFYPMLLWGRSSWPLSLPTGSSSATN